MTINEQNKFLNYNFSKKPVDDSVKVEFDPKLAGTAIKKTQSEIEKERKEYLDEKKDLIGKNTNDKLGFESALGKDERVFQLRSGVSSGRIVTVTSACKELKLKRPTIIKYATENDITLFDDEKKVWINQK